MRIGYATIYDATTTATGFSSFNATGYHLARALSAAGARVDYLGPLRETYGPYYWAKQFYHRRFTRKTYNRLRETRPLRDFAKQIAAKLTDHDLVFSPISPGSQPVAYLECEQPIVICADGTLASAVQNYPTLSWEASVRSNLNAGLENEASALQRARLIFYPSHWAARSAVAQYGLEPAKVKVVPWAANLECNRTFNEIEWMVQQRSEDVCRILFVGMDWERKGGPTVVAAVEELHRRGLRVELNIVGCNPFGSGAVPEFIRVHGRLVRLDRKQAALFDQLFATSHFFFMPSRGEAFGHVFAEASSFGLPSITTDVDGIPSAVRHGVNGLNFPLQTEPAVYADAIANLFFDRDAYRKLAFSAFSEFETRLNWRSAAAAMLDAIESSLRPPKRKPIPSGKAA